MAATTPFRVLIVNNGRREPTATIRLCEDMGGLVTVIGPTDTSYLQEVFDLVVLTGSSGVPAIYLEKEYAELLMYLRTTATPVFGICYGAQLINLAFGGTLRDRGEGQKLKGLFVIMSSDVSSYLPADDLMLVYKGHRWVIDRVAPAFWVHAMSASGPEMIVHVDRPIVGVQFHPEKERELTRASEVFKEFVRQHVRVDNYADHLTDIHISTILSI